MNTEISRMCAVWRTLSTDTKLSLYVTEQDLSYFESRVKAEGLSFLTVTLPSLGKSMYAAFESGILSPCEGLRRVKDCPYPYFLRKAWETLFSKEGELLWNQRNEGGVHNPLDIIYSAERSNYSSAAACIAQLTLMFYKLKLPYSDQQVMDVSTSFIATEDFLSNFSLEKQEEATPGLTAVLNQARRFMCRLLHRFNPMDIQPAHGSGASSCRTKPWERYSAPRYVPKLDAVYDYGTWFYSGLNSLVDNLDELAGLETHQELSARVCFVPKDSRGPRLISTEPREYMYIQQGLMTLMYQAIEAYPMVRSMVSCIDQTRNRDLACLGSLTGLYGTIDLKDASDRVSLELVERLFPSNWVRCLKSCRSDRTELPDGRIVHLKKFAPMGSACCFPVEALVFWAISLASVVIENRSDSNSFEHKLFQKPVEEGIDSHLVSVFGDDIIAPTHCLNKIMQMLTACGLSINKSKCFTKGPFRESCGGDYFLGSNIAPVRWNFIPLSSGSTNAINHAKFRACDSMNNLIMRYGAWELADPLCQLFTSWYHPIPVVAFSNYTRDVGQAIGLALIGEHDKLPRLIKIRRHPRYQSRQMFLQVEVAVDRKVDNSDWCHVLRSLLDKGGLKGTSVVSLAKRVKYRHQWVTV